MGRSILHFKGCFINFTTIERIRMFQAEKSEEDRSNKPRPLSLQCKRRKGRRMEELPQLLSVVSSRENDVKMGVPDTP